VPMSVVETVRSIFLHFSELAGLADVGTNS